ncbi:MAG: hypothetical protein II897_03880 [Clostridia bacterium]|nr:hypothetical protein [Clostridia bacterium]
MELKTKNGYDMYAMSSMLQKAIRRKDIPHAAYAANELSEKYRKYLWKRLLTVSAEDCYGIMTKEIVALEAADEFVNKGSKGVNDLFIAKAVVLLCMARKNRDADYVACNFMWGDRLLTDEEFDKFVDYEQVARLKMEHGEIVPDYVYDCHTWQGKRKGLTARDMFQTENAALQPKQIGFFDEGSYGNYYQHFKEQGAISPQSDRKWKAFMAGKETDPTHNGENI